MPQMRSDKLAVIVPAERKQVLSYRRSFERRLEVGLAIAKQAGRQVGVFSIRINCDPDRRRKGEHVASDRHFTTLQQQLPHLAAPTDLIGRPWQDGLAIVHYSARESFDIYRSAKRLLLKLEQLLHGERAISPFKLSLGIALYPNDGNTPSTLLDHAYTAAERADRRDQNGFCFFSRSAGREVADRLSIDVALLRALKAGAVDMRFQPIVDLRQSCMIGANAEPSWRHPERGDQSAEVIMRAVERVALARIYNAWLVERICRQSDSWSRRLRRQRIGIRVTRSQLADAALATRLSATLDIHNVPACLIEVAIDGKLLLDETDHRLRSGLQQLADLGVQLTVVNIGTESLPLDGLRTLPLNAVEFAPGMVSTIGRCSASERMLSALASFMSTLGLRTRAVGVMTEDQLDFLRVNHCAEITGPLLAPPMRGEDIDRLTEIQSCIDRSEWQGLTERKLMPMH